MSASAIRFNHSLAKALRAAILLFAVLSFGKERPITIGVVVESDSIERVQILAYREPRGGEVRHPFFLEQFEGLGLSSDHQLTGRIDGISGATLSVRAVSNVSRYALYLDRAVRSEST